MKLDKKDFKLLYELDKNSRLSYSQLSKRVRLSQESVRYRISRLVKDRIINKFFTVIEYNHETGLIQNTDIKDESYQHCSTVEFSGYDSPSAYVIEDVSVIRNDGSKTPFGEKHGDIMVETSLLAFHETYRKVKKE